MPPDCRNLTAGSVCSLLPCTCKHFVLRLAHMIAHTRLKDYNILVGSSNKAIKSGFYLSRILARGPPAMPWLRDGRTRAHIPSDTHDGYPEEISLVAFSSDGCKRASASNNQTIQLSGEELWYRITTIQRFSDCVRPVAFSADRARLASGEAVRLWDATTGTHITTHSNKINISTYTNSLQPACPRGLGRISELHEVRLGLEEWATPTPVRVCPSNRYDTIT